jgi:hypothetical protein
VKNEKTMLLSLVMIFHFMLELFQPHFLSGFLPEKKGEKGNLFPF